MKDCLWNLYMQLGKVIGTDVIGLWVRHEVVDEEVGYSLQFTITQ